MHPSFVHAPISAFPLTVPSTADLPVPTPHLPLVSQFRCQLLRATFPTHNAVQYLHTQTAPSPIHIKDHSCGFYLPVRLLVYWLGVQW